MIPRYKRKKMAQIWESNNKYNLWLEIECAACDKMAEIGLIPKEAAKNIRKKAKFDIPRIEELEVEIKHDVIAFLTNVSENVGEDSKYIHKGMTSSDIIDTALSIQLKQASEIIIEDINILMTSLKKICFDHKFTPIMGRSHGIHAEKTTFGLKFAGHYAEFKRNLFRMQIAKNEISTCALSGPVGTFGSIDPRIEKHVADKLGLMAEPISTQIIPRDRHAAYFSTLSVVASSIERIATEIRNLQRTEILEVEEYFAINQKGSSAMPHKRNPILSENLVGLARYIRGITIPALENVSLWNERDISHSSAERIIAPDSTMVIDFALHRLNNIIKNLIIYPENMKKNIDKLKGLTSSQYILLALIETGISREESYEIVQNAAMATWSSDISFKESLLKNHECKNKLGEEMISKIINNDDYKKNVHLIFNRIFDND